MGTDARGPPGPAGHPIPIGITSATPTTEASIRKGRTRIVQGIGCARPGRTYAQGMRAFSILRRAATSLLLAAALVASAAGPARAAPEAVFDTPIPAPAEPEGWRVLVEGPFRIHHDPSDGRAARVLADRAESDLATLVAYVGEDPGAPLDVWLAPTARRFKDLQGGRAPDWAVGTAWPSSRRVFLRTRDLPAGNTLARVFVHELTHVVLGRAVGERPIPRWLNEGLAQHAAGEIGPGTHAALVNAVIGRRIVPLSSLERRFPYNPTAVRLAYAESADFVAFLVARFGTEAVADLVQGLAAGVPADRALLAATGSTAGHLEEAWRDRLRLTHGWVAVLAGGGFVWGFATALFLVAAAVRTARRRRDLARLDREERLAPPPRAWEPMGVNRT